MKITEQHLRDWANGRLVKRATVNERVHELNHDGRVYVLDYTGVATLQLTSVIPIPSEKLLEKINRKSEI